MIASWRGLRLDLTGALGRGSADHYTGRIIAAHQISSGMNIKSYYEEEDGEGRSHWWEQFGSIVWIVTVWHFTRGVQHTPLDTVVQQHWCCHWKETRMKIKTLKKKIQPRTTRRQFYGVCVSVQRRETSSLSLKWSEAERGTGGDKEGDWIPDLFSAYEVILYAAKAAAAQRNQTSRLISPWHTVWELLYLICETQMAALVSTNCLLLIINTKHTAAKPVYCRKIQ